MPPSEPPPPLADAFEMTSLSFEVGDDSGKAKTDDPFPFLPTRDMALAPDTRENVPLGGPLAPPAPPAAPADSPALAVAPAPEPMRGPEPPPEPVRPTGRALADLYYAQGHYAEALQIYDDLVMRHPFDDELKRMRRDAEARLLPASTTSAAAQDAGLERRLARIRALKQWLSLVQAG
jgi:hypothetical protein